MKKRSFATQDLTTTWRESIAVKIAAVVLYTTVLLGIVTAAALLWNAEERFEQELSAKADRLAYNIGDAEFAEHGISSEESKEKAEHWLMDYGFTSAVVSRNGRTIQVGSPGENFVVIRRPDPTTPNAEILLYHRSAAEMVRSRRNTVVLVAVVSAIIFGMFLTLVIRRFITLPIQALVKATREATDGDLRVRADATREDEFGVLAQFFNKMLSQIQNRDRELELHRKHLEEEVSLRTIELRESNEDLKRFMYTAAHDLRQPLVNIEGFSSELRKSIKESIDIVSPVGDRCTAEERDKLNRIYEKDITEATDFLQSSVRQMGTLISALLKLSQADYLKLKFERISMNKLMQDLLSDNAQLISEKHAMVDVDNLPDIMGDHRVVEQIMKNLFDNALKYLVPGRPGKVEIGGEMANNGNVIFHVRDNGQGISPNELPRLFQIFRRLGRPEEEEQSVGVGLAVSKVLVKRHRGLIWCESELGKGSTFHFTLPRSPLFDE